MHRSQYNIESTKQKSIMSVDDLLHSRCVSVCFEPDFTSV